MALDRVRLLRIEELAHEVQKFPGIPGYPWVTHCYGFGELALLWTIK